MTEMRGGVWAIISCDYSDYIEKVFESEIEALRALNETGYGRAAFIPWGVSLSDMEKAES